MVRSSCFPTSLLSPGRIFLTSTVSETWSTASASCSAPCCTSTSSTSSHPGGSPCSASTARSATTTRQYRLKPLSSEEWKNGCTSLGWWNAQLVGACLDWCRTLHLGGSENRDVHKHRSLSPFSYDSALTPSMSFTVNIWSMCQHRLCTQLQILSPCHLLDQIFLRPSQPFIGSRKGEISQSVVLPGSCFQGKLLRWNTVPVRWHSSTCFIRAVFVTYLLVRR